MHAQYPWLGSCFVVNILCFLSKIEHNKDIHIVVQATMFLVIIWGQDEMVAILQTIFSNPFLVLLFKFYTYFFPRVQLRLTSFGSENVLEPNSQQTMILSDDVLDYWHMRHSASMSWYTGSSINLLKVAEDDIAFNLAI